MTNTLKSRWINQRYTKIYIHYMSLFKSWGWKFYYKMEGNWGYTGSKVFCVFDFVLDIYSNLVLQVQDTADQDADKARTYDYARVEYSHLSMILYIGNTIGFHTFSI